MVSRKIIRQKKHKVKRNISARRKRKVSFTKRYQKDSLKIKLPKILGIILILLIVLGGIGTSFSLAMLAKYTKELPDPDAPFEKNQDLTSFIYDRNGNILYKVHGDQNREITKLEDIPLGVIWAFIAAEDVDFYTHHGIDLGGIAKAFMYEAFHYGNPRGGSTITQQTIKNTVLTSERSYNRKLKEIILSLQIEQVYTKDQILQLYLNEIGFGGNTYGIDTAADVYFDKDVKELSLAEGAFLAGLPQAPGLYSPLFAADTSKARDLSFKSQQNVLDQMEEKIDVINGYIRTYYNWDNTENFLTEDMIDAARTQVLAFQSTSIPIEAPHFVFYVEQELQKGNYNNGRPFTLAEIERGGLKITTSLDLDYQHLAEETVKNGVENITKQHGGNNAALVSIDPKTGQILAMVGSADYFGAPYPEGCTLGLSCTFEPNVNVAVALRQPGSSIKPFVYYSGFETGQLYPAYPLVDTAIDFGGGYIPRNNSGTYRNAAVTARVAIRESLNVPAVEAVQIVGVDNFISVLQKFGYTSFTNPQNFGPSIGLGAGEVSLIEHTNAFGVFANQGNYHPLSPILKIEDKNGNILYDYSIDESRVAQKVADERAVYLINDVTKYYHYKPSKLGYEFSGKTGTTDNNTNNYYMGWSTEIVTGVWVGNNDNSRMNRSAYGYSTARYLWMNYTEKILDKITPTSFPVPGGIVRATVCADNGMISRGGCSTVTDLFIQNKLPPIDNASQGTRACQYVSTNVAGEDETPVYEKKYVCNNTWSRYIVAPKPEWQVYWDNVL